MVVLGALAGVALLGFLAGLLSLKAKSRWCPRCGGMTVSPGNRQGAA